MLVSYMISYQFEYHILRLFHTWAGRPCSSLLVNGGLWLYWLQCLYWFWALHGQSRAIQKAYGKAELSSNDSTR